MDDILFGDKTDKPNVKKSKIKMHINDLRVQANIDAYKREEIKYKNYYRNMLETCVNEIETKGHEALVNNRVIAEHMAELYLKVIIINIIIHLRGYKNDEKDTDLIYYKPEDILKIIQQLIGFYEFNDFPITQSLVEFFSSEVEGKTSLVTETTTTSSSAPYSPPLHSKTKGISWFGKLNVFALQSTFYIPFMHTNQLEHKLKHSTIVSYNDVYDAKLLRRIFLSTLNKGKFNETTYIDYKNIQEKLLEKIPNAKNTHLWPDSLYTLLNFNVKEDGIVLITPLIYFSVELTNKTFANKLYICGGSFSKIINVHGNDYDSYLFMLHDIVHLYVYKQFCLPNVTENIRKFYYYYNDVIKRMTGKTEAEKKLIKDAVGLFFFIITHETGPTPTPEYNNLCIDMFSCDKHVLKKENINNNPFFKNLDNLFNVQLDIIKKFYNGDLPIPAAYKSDKLDEKVYTYIVLCCNLFFNFFAVFCTEGVTRGVTMMPYIPKDLNILETDYHAKNERVKENPNPSDIELIKLYNAYTSKVVAEQISKQISSFVPGRQQVPEEFVIDFKSENIINNLEHFSQLKTITASNVEDFQLEDIANKLQYLPKLKELTIKDSNALVGLPESIGTNQNLQKLVIRNNNSLRSIPESIGTQENLGILIIENNDALSSVPASIGSIRTVSNRNNKSLVVGGGGKKRSKKKHMRSRTRTRKNKKRSKNKRIRKGTRRINSNIKF